MFTSPGDRGGRGRPASSSTTVLTTGTSLTYTVPQGVHRLFVRVMGGGGGGGGADGTTAGTSAGGSGGGYAEKTYNVVPGQTFGYTIGALGAGGTAGNNSGSNATASTWDLSGAVPVVGNGGQGGGSMLTGTTLLSTSPGTPGTGTGGDVNIQGQYGALGIRYSGTVLWPGNGGNSMLGVGGVGTYASAGVAAFGYGGGGGGVGVFSGNADRAGGDGSPGVIIVEEYP